MSFVEEEARRCHQCGIGFAPPKESSRFCSRSCANRRNGKSRASSGERCDVCAGYLTPGQACKRCPRELAAFWAKAAPVGECWEWQGKKRNRGGYGRFCRGRKMISAHRHAWSLANGRPVPGGMFVLHRCDNPPCIRPEHLFLGTHQENMDDKVQKGRQARGLTCTPLRNRPGARALAEEGEGT